MRLDLKVEFVSRRIKLMSPGSAIYQSNSKSLIDVAIVKRAFSSSRQECDPIVMFNVIILSIFTDLQEPIYCYRPRFMNTLDLRAAF